MVAQRAGANGGHKLRPTRRIEPGQWPRSRRKPSEARPFETGVQEATPLAEQLREPCQFDYDRARYPFAELVAEALGLSDPTALATFACCADM